jgi:hydrogenase expression/formation protein HypC
MQIKKIKADSARVEAAGLLRTINIRLLPHIKTGDYVIVHAGFAIEKLNPKRAKDALRLINEIR